MESDRSSSTKGHMSAFSRLRQAPAQNATVFSILALAILALLGVLAFVILNRGIAVHQASDTVLNLMNDQRVLSQRMLLLGYRLVDENLTRSERDGIREELRDAATLFETSHEELANSEQSLRLPGDLPQDLRSILYEPPTFLDEKGRAYIAEIRKLMRVSDPDLTHNHLSPTRVAAVELHAALEDAVALYREEAEAEFAQFQRGSIFMLSVFLLALLLASAFIFQPMLRHMKEEKLKLVREIAERRRTERVVRQQHRLLHSVLESLSHPSYIVDVHDYTLKMANTVALQGKALEDLTCYALAYGREAPCIGEGFPCPLQEVKQTGESAIVEHLHRDRAGATRNVEVRGYPVFDDMGKVVQVIEHALDMSERKQVEKALHTSEERFRRLAENAQDIIYRYRFVPSRGFEYVSPAVITITGYTPEEYYADPDLIAKMVLEDDVRLWKQSTSFEEDTALSLLTDSAQQVMQRLTSASEGLLRPVAMRWVRKDRSIIWVEVRNVPVYDEYGNLVAIEGIVRDTTERKRAEEALKASELQYRATLDSMGDLIHVIDADMRFVLFNAALRQLNRELGLETDVVGKLLSDVFPFLSERVRDEYQQVFDTGEVLITEETSTVADRVFTTETRKIPIFIGKTVTQIVTVIRDITERKKMEEELRESEEKARALLNAPTDAVILLDADGIVLDTNETMARRLDKTVVELVGVSVWDFFPPDVVERRMAIAKEVLSSGEIARLEDERQGIWNDTVVYPLLDTRGNVTKFAVIARDITERKRMEEALRQAHDELEKRVEERTAELLESNRRLTQVIEERKQAEAAEREQRTLAEALCDSAGALNSTLDLDEVLKRILANVGQVVRHDAASIMLVENGSAHVVRVHGHDRYGQEKQVLKLCFPVDSTPNLRRMAKTGEPLVVPDTRGDPDWVILPETSWIRSYAGAPICQKGEVIGFLNLDSAEVGFFSPEHAERLRAFADQAAIAIQNAKLYEQAQALAALEERQRLARDLHDVVSQTLFSASVIAGTLSRSWERNSAETRKGLAELHRLTRHALAEMRALLLELRPMALVEADLGDLLHRLIEAVAGQTPAEIKLTVEGKRSLPPDVQIALYRIIQEALNNAIKYAHAGRVKVSLCHHSNNTELHIHDDGCGFDPAQVSPECMGISIMRERAEAAGAQWILNSQSGKGTEIMVVWPVR